MSALPAVSLEAMIESIARRVVQEELSRGATGPDGLLSLRAAARLLRVGRGGTLRRLINSGRLKVVVLEDGRERIARAEIDRFLTEGVAPAVPIPRRTPPRVREQKAAPATLRRLSVEDL